MKKTTPLKSLLAVGLVAGFLFGCSGNSGNSQQGDLSGENESIGSDDVSGNALDPATPNTIQGQGQEVGACFGRVIDRSTRNGIAGAKVEVFSGWVAGTNSFVAQSTTTASDDAATTLWNETGMWSVADLPTNASGKGYRVRVGASGYAQAEFYCNFAGLGSQDNTPISQDVGDIALSKSSSLTVYLNKNGAVVTNCPVFAYPIKSFDNSDPEESLNAQISGVEISGVTNASGFATLGGLNPLVSYEVVAPACDTNNDGSYDHLTSFQALDSLSDSNATIVMEVNPAAPDDPLMLVDTNAKLVADQGAQFPMENLLKAVSGQTLGIGKQGLNNPNYLIDDVLSVPEGMTNIVLVFNYPVILDAGETIGFYYLDNLVSSANYTFSSVFNDFGGCTLSAGNTVLTCAPANATSLSVNQLIHLAGTVYANVPSESNNGTANMTMDLGDLDQDGLTDSWYIEPTTAWTSASVTADNYNGTNLLANSTKDLVYLEFPELVYGTWQLVNYRSDGGASASNVDFSMCNGNLTDLGSWLYASNDLGNNVSQNQIWNGAYPDISYPNNIIEESGFGTGIVYRVRLQAPGCEGTSLLADTSNGGQAAVRNVRVYVDATDVTGNHIEGLLTIGIQ